MANATVSRLGDANSAGSDVTQLFLKQFAGEVLTAFQTNTVMLDKHLVRTISSGLSAQFPATGKSSAAMHTPGAELVGTEVFHNQITIAIDGLLVSHHFIANIDEAMNHYDVRAIYSDAMGKALAKVFDINCMKEVVKGSVVGTARITGPAAAGTTGTGTVVTDANFDSATAADKLAAWKGAIFTAAATFDTNGVPMDERFLIVNPTIYYYLVQQTDLINKDWGGQGSLAQGTISQVGGIRILASPDLPQTDTSGTDTYHGVDASLVDAICFGKDAVATVKLMDMSVEAAYDIRRQGTLMVAKYAMGHGYLRIESCISFKDTV